MLLGACTGKLGGASPDGGAIDPDGGGRDAGGGDGGDYDAGARADGGTTDGGMLEWVVTLPVFVAGVATPFDLASTLPPSVVRGGVFSIDPIGAPLPAGMELTRAGLLSAGTAAPSSMDGVVFAYEEP